MNTLERLLYGGGFLFDDVAITAGVGTAIGCDTITGVNYQRVKLISGVDGVNDGDVSAALGLPVKPQTGLGAVPFPIGPGLRTTEQLTRVAISCNTLGDNIIVAASPGNIFRLYALLFTVDSPVSVKLGEGGPTYWTGAMKYGAGSGLLLTNQGEPHFMTSVANKSFLINLAAGVQCSGVAWYTLVP